MHWFSRALIAVAAGAMVASLLIPLLAWVNKSSSPVAVGLLIIFLLLPEGIALQVYLWITRHYGPPPWDGMARCWKCGYNLVWSTSGVCPECGEPARSTLIRRTAPRENRSRARFAFVLGALTGCIAAIVMAILTSPLGLAGMWIWLMAGLEAAPVAVTWLVLLTMRHAPSTARERFQATPLTALAILLVYSIVFYAIIVLMQRFV